MKPGQNARQNKLINCLKFNQNQTNGKQVWVREGVTTGGETPRRRAVNGKLWKLNDCLLAYAKRQSQAQPAPRGQKMPDDSMHDTVTPLWISEVRDSAMTFFKPGLLSFGKQLCGAVTAARPMGNLSL